MKRRRGQGLVEFALILPVLLLIILGIVEAAFLIQGFLTVQHAAREAARFAVAYQPVQGHKLDGDPCELDDTPDLPFSDPAQVCNRDEDDAEYYARRVALIKQVAYGAASGLRINDGYLGDTPERFKEYKDEPAFFGVVVWGYPSFKTDCNDRELRDKPWDPTDDSPGCLDHPGLEGLPIQVLVVHNVEIVDPFYRAVVEYVPVRADTEMINEGIQVGFGDVVPPDFSTNPDFGETPLPTNTSEFPSPTPTHTPTHTPTPTSTPTPTPTPTPVYFVQLSEDATNDMPDERDHEFVAAVTDGLGQHVEEERVSFSADEGAFDYSGVGSRYAERVTDGLGQASVTLYGNQPGSATVRAWLDFDGDTVWDSLEPYDTAVKTWSVFGPYVIVSDHEVIPQQYITADVMDHDPASNSYRLLWCAASGAGSTVVLLDPVNVDATTGDATNLGFEVPDGSEGLYRLETHSDGGDCGSGDLVAYSADISLTTLPQSVSIGGETQVLVGGVPWTLEGVEVWAYSVDGSGGELYHAVTGPDGTYSFQNLPPGTYTVYSEMWIGGWLLFATATVEADEGDYPVNLFLL